MNTLAIGFDGMDPRILFANLDRLPTFRAITERGVWGELESVEVDPEAPRCTASTGPAWWTFYTGLTPHHHGITAEGQGGWLTTSLKPRVEPFRAVREAGLKVAMLNCPCTYPVRDWGDLHVVAGYPAPWRGEAFDPAKMVGPEELRKFEILWMNFGGGWMDRMKRSATWPTPNDLYSACFSSVGARAEMGRLLRQASTDTVELVREYLLHRSPDLLTVAIMESDAWGHIAQALTQAELLDAYIFLDGILADLITAAPADNIVVFSDHGNDLDRPDHALQGIFLAAGPAWAGGGQVEGLRLLDLHQTLCASLGVDRGGADGKVDRRVLAGTGELTSAEEAAVAERLRGLGYID